MAFNYAPDVKSFPAAVSIGVDTGAAWASHNPILMEGFMAMDSDTGFIKIGDGVTRYNDLGNLIEATLTTAQRAMLDNANAANGLLQLDGGGKIPLDLLPAGVVSGAVKFVADITARDALVDEQRDGLIFVLDASADPTVTASSAQYVWNAAGAEGAGEWEKIGEKESLDLDAQLADKFSKTEDTLDVIADGTSFVKMTIEERDTVATLATDAIRITDAIHFQGYNAAQTAALSAV